MEADVLIHTTFPYHFLQRLADGPIVQVGEHEVVFLERSVTLYYLQGNVQQFHLERYARLMPFGDNPLLAVHFHDAVVGQFLDVHERKGGEARKHEQVTDVRQLRVCELVRHHRFQFIFCQELTLLDIRTEFGLMWNCANGFLGISPLKCALITTPFSHMHFSHIVPLRNPASVER